MISASHSFWQDFILTMFYRQFLKQALIVSMLCGETDGTDREKINTFINKVRDVK